MEKQFIVFELWGDYAHFRKFYTTSSPLTYPFPPKPTIIGILSSILGFDKKNNEYLKHFEKDTFLIALQLINPVKKIKG